MDGQCGTGGGRPMHPPDQPMRTLSTARSKQRGSIALVYEGFGKYFCQSLNMDRELTASPQRKRGSGAAIKLERLSASS